MTAATLWQVARVPILLVLLGSLSRFQPELTAAQETLDLERALAPWAAIVLLAVAFMVVALVRRGRQQPRSVLAVEAVLAAGIGLVPPMLWIHWFGLSWIAWVVGAATGDLLVPGLAMAWLVIATHTLVRTVREPNRSATAHTGALRD